MHGDRRHSPPRGIVPVSTVDSCAIVAVRHHPANLSEGKSALPQNIEERVIRVIAEAQQIDRDKITSCSTFAELGIDSFDGINILFAIESEFDISVGDEEAKQLRSVAQAVESVGKLLQEKR